MRWWPLGKKKRRKQTAIQHLELPEHQGPGWRALWERYVPERGQADTEQGELLWTTSRLSLQPRQPCKRGSVMDTAESRAEERSIARRVGEALLKIVGMFVILEPIWMLLPFAGFLYGSLLRIQTLNRNPQTAWLTHFVFPVLTLGWLGPALVVLGFGLFLVGAGQIYWAKIRRSGLVTGGLYRFVRHPQYIALTLFGVGILLTWGRAIMFLTFFVMMFLYYYLARSEERRCLRLFGRAYERYRARTSFVIPGDRLLRPLRARKLRPSLPGPLRAAGAFVATMAICLALMWLITAVKLAVRTVPFTVAVVPLSAGAAAATRTAVVAGEAGGVPFVHAGRLAVVRGPYRSAAGSGFAERVLLRVHQSEKLAGFLGFLDRPGEDVAIVFCAPFVRPEQPGQPGTEPGLGPSGRGPNPDPSGPDRVRLMIIRCRLAPGAGIGDALAEKSRRTIVAACIAPVDLDRPAGEDIVAGELVRPGPGFPGEQRWDVLMRQLADRRTRRRTAPRSRRSPAERLRRRWYSCTPRSCARG